FFAFLVQIERSSIVHKIYDFVVQNAKTGSCAQKILKDFFANPYGFLCSSEQRVLLLFLNG
ncbi:hypothetical protein COT07_04745, partial [Candidatus Woesearchaeota archaeon CG07_land_8_20_14_0_80_44_23]